MSKECSVLIDIEEIRTHIFQHSNAFFSSLDLPVIDSKTALVWAREYVTERLHNLTIPGSVIHGTSRLKDYLCSNHPVMNLTVNSKTVKDEPYLLYEAWEGYAIDTLEDTYSIQALFTLPISIHYRYLSFEHAGSTTVIYVGEDIRDVLFNQLIADKGLSSLVEEVSNRYREDLLKGVDNTALPESIELNLETVRPLVHPIDINNNITEEFRRDRATSFIVVKEDNIDDILKDMDAKYERLNGVAHMLLRSNEIRGKSRIRRN